MKYVRVLDGVRLPVEWALGTVVPIFERKGDIRTCSCYLLLLLSKPLLVGIGLVSVSGLQGGGLEDRPSVRLFAVKDWGSKTAPDTPCG